MGEGSTDDISTERGGDNINKTRKWKMKFSTFGKDPKFREMDVTAPDTRTAWKKVKKKYKTAAFGDFVKTKGYSYPSGKSEPKII